MVDVSFLEAGIALFIELLSITMLIITVIRDPPTQRASSIVRAVYLIPGMICAGALIGMGPKFTGLTTITHTNAVNGSMFTPINNATQFTDITVLNVPFWWELHLMIFLVLLSYILIQILTLFTKSE